MADADTILNELIAEIVRENDWKDHEVEVKAITSGGANYTSGLYLVNIVLPDKDVKLFAKVATVGEQLREVMMADRLFYLEAFFYNNLIKTYEKLQDARGLDTGDRLVCPKFYACNTRKHQETIVLENLVARGYSVYSRFKSLDWEHAAASVESLAKFHALSFAYQKSDPEGFEVVCRDLKYVRKETTESRKDLWKEMVRRSLQGVGEELCERVWRSLRAGGTQVYVQYRYPLSTPVIAHGDYRPSNILYKKEGSKVHAMPVDFQTLHTGSPAADLVYVETLGTDSAFRAENHDRLIDHYYSELEKALKRLGVDATEVYPRDVFDSELKKTQPYAVVLGICLLPTVLVDADDAPKFDGSEVEMDKLLIKGTDVYAERFLGIIEDCARWGAI